MSFNYDHEEDKKVIQGLIDALRFCRNFIAYLPNMREQGVMAINKADEALMVLARRMEKARQNLAARGERPDSPDVSPEVVSPTKE